MARTRGTISRRVTRGRVRRAAMAELNTQPSTEHDQRLAMHQLHQQRSSIPTPLQVGETTHQKLSQHTPTHLNQNSTTTGNQEACLTNVDEEQIGIQHDGVTSSNDETPAGLCPTQPWSGDGAGPPGRHGFESRPTTPVMTVVAADASQAQVARTPGASALNPIVLE